MTVKSNLSVRTSRDSDDDSETNEVHGREHDVLARKEANLRT